MIDYQIHQNGWTVISDTDLRNSTQEDINQIAKLIASNTLVVFKNQSLSVEDQLRILKMFKEPEPLYQKDDPFFEAFVADIDKDPDGIICRVTAEKDEHGREGMAGWEDGFDWHCNMPEIESRRPIVWIYGVRGTKGSRTSFNNTILVYKDLDEDFKKRIEHLHSIYGNISAESPDHVGVDYNTSWLPPLVYRNIANKVGLYFSPLQIQKFAELSQEESDEIKNYLAEFVLRDKYVYHHDWDDGDLLLTEQWLGIHKRWAFDKMDQRVLHRSAVDFPDQDYTND